MPSLARELQSLQLADLHIARAEASLNRVTASSKDDPASADVLAAHQHSLREFRKHRALIVEIIDDIRSGRMLNDDPAPVSDTFAQGALEKLKALDPELAERFADSLSKERKR
jgi:hypothetical protein